MRDDMADVNLDSDVMKIRKRQNDDEIADRVGKRQRKMQEYMVEVIPHCGVKLAEVTQSDGLMVELAEREQVSATVGQSDVLILESVANDIQDCGEANCEITEMTKKRMRGAVTLHCTGKLEKISNARKHEVDVTAEAGVTKKLWPDEVIPD